MHAWSTFTAYVTGWLLRSKEWVLRAAVDWDVQGNPEGQHAAHVDGSLPCRLWILRGC